MLVSPSMSPALGVFVTSPNHVNHRKGFIGNCRRDRYGAKSAPPQVWHKRSQLRNNQKSKVQHVSNSPCKTLRNCSTAGVRRMQKQHSAVSINEDRSMKLSVDEVLWLAEQTREVTSLENRRSVLEEAQRTIRQETSIPDNSRPHSVIGVGLQAMTSPMPLSAKSRAKPGQVDHIPTLLPLPSDRTFIPSPDQDHARHMTTPTEDNNVVWEERAHSVAKQCCEIMGPSLCRTCRKLESRLLNREQAEKECPRMRITQENITTTQVVKRLYPRLTDSEIQDKIARGEIARTGFPPTKCHHHRRRFDSNSSGDESDDSEEPSSSSEEISDKKENDKQKLKFHCQHVSTLMLELSKLKKKLKNQTSTPLFFTDLKRVQAKILSGEVDRKKYLTKEPREQTRLKSAISSISTTSSNKTTLSKLGVRLSESLMPVFVSPRKVKMHEEPSYKAYYEPPLLSKRRQIPNPSFFAGSSEAYSLPERLPDIIEFADSKIKLLEKQGRSMSSMSMISNMSEDYDTMMSERAGESGRSGDNTLNLSNSQRDLKMQLVIQEQCEQSNHDELNGGVNCSGQERCKAGEENNTIVYSDQKDSAVSIRVPERDLGGSSSPNNEEKSGEITGEKNRGTLLEIDKKVNEPDNGVGDEGGHENVFNDHLDDDGHGERGGEPGNEGDSVSYQDNSLLADSKSNIYVNETLQHCLDSGSNKNETVKHTSSFTDNDGYQDNLGGGVVSENAHHSVNDEGLYVSDGGGNDDVKNEDGDNVSIGELCLGSSSALGDNNKEFVEGLVDTGKQNQITDIGLTTPTNDDFEDDNNSVTTANDRVVDVERQDSDVSSLDNSNNNSDFPLDEQHSEEEDDLQDGWQSEVNDYGDDEDEEEGDEDEDKIDETTGHSTRQSIHSDD